MKSKTSFRLPPDVSFEKQRLSNAWAYVFRHRLLGEIGRILLQELGDGRCHISCEVVGDPSDPMTTQREAIFKPLGLELTRQMEAVMGRTPEDAGLVDIPPRPPETKEMIESKLIPCERCGTVVAMLIFAPNATDPGHFEDYARKMYPHYNHLNVPTWILGPALGEGPLIERPADVQCGRRGSRFNGYHLRNSICSSISSLRGIVINGQNIWPSGFRFTLPSRSRGLLRGQGGRVSILSWKTSFRGIGSIGSNTAENCCR